MTVIDRLTRAATPGPLVDREWLNKAISDTSHKITSLTFEPVGGLIVVVGAKIARLSGGRKWRMLLSQQMLYGNWPPLSSGLHVVSECGFLPHIQLLHSAGRFVLGASLSLDPENGTFGADRNLSETMGFDAGPPNDAKVQEY